MFVVRYSSYKFSFSTSNLCNPQSTFSFTYTFLSIFLYIEPSQINSNDFPGTMWRYMDIVLLYHTQSRGTFMHLRTFISPYLNKRVRYCSPLSFLTASPKPGFVVLGGQWTEFCVGQWTELAPTRAWISKPATLNRTSLHSHPPESPRRGGVWFFNNYRRILHKN